MPMRPFCIDVGRAIKVFLPSDFQAWLPRTTANSGRTSSLYRLSLPPINEQSLPTSTLLLTRAPNAQLHRSYPNETLLSVVGDGHSIASPAPLS